MKENQIIDNVWKIEQEILDIFHSVCLENNLKYSLAYGTLIGAVRHKGFIPWDDDIDIMMPREDYEKLLILWEDKAPKGYLIQNYHCEEDYTNNFAKIRKEHTTFIQDECEFLKKYQKGIFIDVFPCDRIASGVVGRKIQFLACAFNLLYTRGFNSGKTGLIGFLEKKLLKVNKKKAKYIRDHAEKIVRKWNSETGNRFMVACTIECCKIYYPADMFDELNIVEFNAKKYMAVKDIDTVLRIQYGNYMQLPPQNERTWKHHPLIIDFEHDYEELDKY